MKISRFNLQDLSPNRAYRLGALIIVFCVILSGEGLAYPTPADISSVYYSSIDNPFANSTDYNVGQCTWYVYGRIQETGLITYSKLSSLGFFTGGADTWYANATSAAGIAAGFTTGSQPKSGAIACWNTGSIKHVAFVENTSGTYGQMTESNLMPNKAPSYPYPVVIDGVEGINQTPHLNQNYVWLHSSMDASVSTRIWQIPQFTKLYVTGSKVYDGTYWWFPLSAQDGNPNHTGYAALLDANTGAPVLADDITLNFTCVQLSAGSPWITSAPTYIYLPSGATLPVAFTKQLPPNNTTPVTSQNVTLSWNPSSGGNITYNVTLNGANSVLIQSWSGVTTTSVSGTIPNTYGANYYWQVTAVNSAGSTAADSGNWWSFWAELLNDLTISTTSLPLPATVQGTAGGTATFSVSGVGLSSVDYLTLTAPSGCEISLNGSSFGGAQLIYPDANGNISTTTVYARITTAATANINNSLTIQGHSKTSLLKSIQVSGTVTAPDTAAPTPNPSTWATAPYATGTSSISMTANTSSDPSGVQYYFHCLTTGGHDSSWQAGPTYQDTGLAPSTSYSYQVKTRDQSASQNTGSYSTPALSATTQAASDITPPGNIGSFTATPGNSQVHLTWSNPTDSDYAGVQIIRKTGSYPTSRTDGTSIYNINGTSTTDTGLANGTTYYYKAFSYDGVPNYSAGVTASATPQPISITVAIDQHLLDLIDQYAPTYYRSTWNMNIEQFKAWVATIACGEGGNGGYGAHSQGNPGTDLFAHKDYPSFTFSTGIGPFQLDRGGYDGWGTWPSNKKLDPAQAVQTVMEQHYTQFQNAGVTLQTFANGSKWNAVLPGNIEALWSEVTGTTWSQYSGGNVSLNWSTIETSLAGNANDSSLYPYAQNVQDVGMKTWNIGASANLYTESGKSIIFTGARDTWHITARKWDGTKIFQYYYTYDASSGIEIWVLDNATASQNALCYIFERECNGPCPERYLTNPGDTLSSPALDVGPDTTSFNYSLASGWNTISFPFTPKGPDGTSLFSAIFSGVSSSDLFPYVFYMKDDGTLTYAAFSDATFSATAKKGYFLYVLNPVTKVISGAAVTDQSISLPHADFNFIGVTQARTVSNNSQVFETAFSFAGDANSVVLTDIFNSNLLPGKGYLVYAIAPTTLLPASSTPSVATPLMAQKQASGLHALAISGVGPDFSGTVLVHQDAWPTVSTPSDKSLVFGVKPDATDGYDIAYDSPYDMPFPGTLTAYFQESNRLATDYKADGAVITWPLVAMSQSSFPGKPDNLNPVRISWAIPDSGTLAAGTTIQLLDGSGNVVVPDMHSTTQIIFSAATAGTVSQYKIQASLGTVTPTRIISLSGNLAFGTVPVGSAVQSSFTISNTGNSTLTVSNISLPSGFSGNWSGPIASNSSQSVSVTFTPTSVTSYNGPVTVNSDATNTGGNTLTASGTGTAVSQYNCTTNSGAITITGYTGSGGAVIIPGTINGLPVTSIGDYTFDESTNLISVTIPNSVTSLGNFALAYCGSLTNVTFGTNVTSIGIGAFDDDTNLASVTLPTSLTSFGIGAFDDCTSLTSITIPINVTNIGSYVFFGCTSLTNVTIGSGVTNLGDYAFEYCTSLRGIYFEGNAPSLGSYVFYGDNNATVYYLSGTTNWSTTLGGLPTTLWLGQSLVTVSVTANPSQGGTATGNGAYAVGTNIQLTAFAANGWVFTTWNTGTTNNPYIITVPASNITYTANFVQTQPPALTSPQPGSTLVSSSLTFQWSSGTEASDYFIYVGRTFGANDLYAQDQGLNRSATVTGLPIDGSTLYVRLWWATSAGWQYIDYTYTALTQNTVNYTIMLSASPSAGGIVSGGGIFASGSSESVAATANNGYTFANWTENGNVVSTSTSYTFALTANRTLAANFTVNPVNYTMAVSASPSAGGSVSGGGTYAAGSSQTMTATANNGFIFANWTESGIVVSTSASTTFTLNANRTLVANFVPTAVLTAQANPATAGSVTGGGTYLAGSTAVLSASASNLWRFISWSDGVTNNPRSVLVQNGGATFTANFSPRDMVSVLANPANGGSVIGGGQYLVGSNASVTAMASNNWLFMNWNGSVTNNPWVFPVVAGTTVCTANFSRLSTVVILASPTNGGLATGGGTYLASSNVSLTATAASNWIFSRWNDGNTNTSRVITVPTTNITYTATFIPPVTVTVRANPVANGSVSGGGTFQIGSNVNLAATPVSGWRFTAWNDGNTNASRAITVPAVNSTYTAGFAMDVGAAVDATNLNWTTGGNASWTVQTATTHDRMAALRSGALGAGQQTWFQTTTNGPGSLQFWWKVSSAPTNQLQFYINTQLVSQISGNVDWNQVVTFLGTSNQVTLKWVYAKNTAAVSGSDAGWVDQVTWTPCPYAEHVPQMFYQDPSGTLASWVLNGTGGFRFARVLANTGGWALKAAGDVDGDGISDLLFQDGASNTGGWFMNADGSVRDARFWFNIGAWEIKACGDYEGTGRGQLFFQTAAGDVAFWRLDTNGVYQSSVPMGRMPGWKLRGVGDLDGDHKAELIWQNAAGQIAIWYHNPDGSIRGASAFSTGNWALCGVTDIDGDGVSDLLWQTPGGDTGGWFMNSNSTARTANFWWNTGAWKLKAAGR